MYKRESGGWLKHCDFLLLDMICLQIAFLLSFVVLGRWVNPYSHILYRKMALYLEVADVAVAFFIGTFSDVLKKGYYRNFVTTVQHAAIVLAIICFISFPIQGGTAVFKTFIDHYIYIVRVHYICGQRTAQA